MGAETTIDPMQVDAAVIGAGAVGLACAMELARLGQRVVLLERHSGIGRETSSRNSGVIHAGLYYPPGSLKAAFCVQGRELLYARCERTQVAFRRTGKLVVAVDDAEVMVLEAMRSRARENGAGELSLIDEKEIARREPNVRAVAALVSPRTGIVDAHGLCASYAREARSMGADVALETTITGIRRGRVWELDTVGADGGRFVLHAVRVVNAAGLEAPAVARRAGLTGSRDRVCKGDYFVVRGPRVNQLIYPVPTEAGLGIHLTLDLAGTLRAGPDTEWVDTPRYEVSAAKAERFASRLRRFFPRVTSADLSPDYAGVRPKLHGPGEAKADFEIAFPEPTIAHLLGIESPGLTASEAIGRYVAERLA